MTVNQVEINVNEVASLFDESVSRIRHVRVLMQVLMQVFLIKSIVQSTWATHIVAGIVKGHCG
jgi:hypothetical protein